MGCAYLILMAALVIPGLLLIVAGAVFPPLALLGIIMCAIAGAITAKAFGSK